MRRAAIPIAAVLAPAAALALLALTGGLSAADAVGLPDPGLTTRWGLPLMQAFRDMCAALTVGVLVVASCCVPPENGSRSEPITGVRRRLADIAILTACGWAIASMVMLGFSYSDASGLPLSSPGFPEGVAQFVSDFAAGQYLVYSAALAGLVAIWSWVAVRPATLGVMALLAVVALWPMALTGHAAGAVDHNTAVNLQMAHFVGIAVWTGGLTALVAARNHLAGGLVATVQRYSTLAGWCLALTAISGVASAVLRLPQPSALASSYGALLGLKVAALGTLAVLGWRQRSRAIGALKNGQPGSFTRLASIEILVMAAAVGTGVALSRSEPPPPSGGEVPLTPAQALLGRDLPPALNAREWLLGWQIDFFWLPVALLMLGWYLLAVHRMHRRGDRWSVGRTVAWCLGWLLFIWATNGSPGAYGQVLFSMHMVQHMTIALAVPTFLVLGAPVTLALRVTRRRTDGSLGPREWLLLLVNSRVAHVVGHPIVAAGLFMVSLVAFYYSDLFEVSLRTHTGHVLMTGHFLLVGYLFANCLVGVDPGPRRPAFPLRALLLMVVFGLHALFSVSLMANETVLAEDWFTALGRTWGASPADDQYTGASLGWALGDYPLAILAVALVAQWVRHDRVERDRFDRHEERDGESQRAGYNAYLDRLSKATRNGDDGRAP